MKRNNNKDTKSQVAENSELWDYIRLSEKMTGLPYDIYVDNGKSYAKRNHDLWLYVQAGTGKIPVTINDSAALKESSKTNDLNLDPLFEFISANKIILTKLADEEIDDDVFFSILKPYNGEDVAEENRKLQKQTDMAEMIIIPDVHGRKFWREAVKGHESQKIVFLGDYVDPYSFDRIGGNQAYAEMMDIIAFKKEHLDNVTLLLGNHDLGYLDENICTCRHDYYREDDICKALLENLDLFDLVHIVRKDGRKVLLSHAGIAEAWVKKHWELLTGDGGFKDEAGVEAFEPLALNRLLHDEASRPALFAALAEVSRHRGGLDEVGSPVWADVDEYLYGEPLLDGYLHLFGHSLHEGDPIVVGKTSPKGLCLDVARSFTLEVDDE
ncbi:MAG: metallophosphoesterase [Bacteroidales bacterium]|nr:metallophosphoesterase [Bacteroidales bacterium]